MKGRHTHDHDSQLRRHLLSLLGGTWAHIDFASAIREFPVELMHASSPELAHTAWDLFYHLNAAQHDILDFLRDRENYVTPLIQRVTGPGARKNQQERKHGEAPLRAISGISRS